MHLRLLVPLVLLAATLAGCSDTPSADGGMPSGGGGQEAPEWTLGDAWSLEDSMGNTFNLAVAGESGGDWLLLADAKPIAWADQVFDISYVGPVSKSDLDGRQGPDRVRYFDFPLTDGKEWTTQWDGIRVHVHATREVGGIYELVATRHDGPVHATYTYDPERRFFGSMEFLDENGTVQYQIKTTGASKGFVGTVYRYGTPETLVGAKMAPGDIHQSVVVVPNAVGDLAASVQAQCGDGSGVILMGLDAPQEDGAAKPHPPAPIVAEPTFGAELECPADGEIERSAVLEPVPGDWRVDAVVGATGGELAFEIAWRPYEEVTVGSV